MTRRLHTLDVPAHVAAQLRDLHPLLKRKIRAALDAILAEPHAGKPLKDELTGLRSFRVGRYRLIYRLSAQRLTLVALGPRESIYEETTRLMMTSNRDWLDEPRARYKARTRRR